MALKVVKNSIETSNSQNNVFIGELIHLYFIIDMTPTEERRRDERNKE